MLVTSKLSIFYGIPLLEQWLPKVHAKAKSCYWNPHHLAEQAVLSLTLLVTVCLPGSFRDARLAKAEQEGPNKISLFMNPRIQLCWRHLPRFFLAQQQAEKKKRRSCNSSTLLSVPRGVPILLGSHLLLNQDCRTDRQHTLEVFFVSRITEIMKLAEYTIILSWITILLGSEIFMPILALRELTQRTLDRRTKD